MFSAMITQPVQDEKKKVETGGGQSSQREEILSSNLSSDTGLRIPELERK